MTLHEAIEIVLRENKRPLTPKAIAFIINAQGYYQRNDYALIETKQILSRVKNYPKLFEQINGQIILVEDQVWKNLLINYSYLTNSLRGIYSISDVQFIVAVLLFYKRCYDISPQNGFKHPLQKNEIQSEVEMMIDGGNSLIEGLFDVERYRIGPAGIFEECARLLLQLDNYKKIEIFTAVQRLNSRELDDKSFGNAFEYFLSIIPKDSLNYALSPTPYSLRELMINILNPQSGMSLFDPVAGIGGLLVQAYYHNQNLNLIEKGTEINKRIAQLGNMNLIMHGLSNVSIRSSDGFEEVNHDATYDYIVADLPSSGVTNSYEHALLFHKYHLEPPRTGKSFGSLVLLILSKLNHQGKAVITVSEGFLMKKGKEKEIRDLLINQDIIESVISLPYGTLRPYTDAKASLLVLNKNKDSSLRNKIRFITANVADQDARSVYLNNEEILSAYKTEVLFSKDSQILAISELRSDTNLSAEGYDEQYMLANLMLKEGSGKLLSELVTVRAGIQPDKVDMHHTGDYPLIKIENLSREITEKDLSQNILSRVYLSTKYQRSVISEKCLLVARIGENLKATIFNPSEQRRSIILHTGVYALSPLDCKDSIDLEYLYYQFHSAFVLEQIKKRKLGAVMPYISIASFKQIVVPYVDRASQKSFIEAQKANLISEEKNRANAILKALGSKDKIRQSESEIIKTLTHQLRPTFMGINSLINRVKRVIEKEGMNEKMEYNDLEQDDFWDPEITAFIQKHENYSVGKLVDKLIADSHHLSDILSTVDKVMNFSLLTDDLHETNLLDFLQLYKKEKDIAINQKFEIVIKGETVIASINKPAFKELLEQLLQNAEDHGFNENIPGKKYRVQFMLRYNRSREVISLEYTNNGAPYNLQHKDFVNAFEKGRHSGGSGIGGNYINRIVEAHRGQIKVVENNERGFSLTIELPTNQTLFYE